MLSRRKQLLIDSIVQGAVIRRMITYWMVTLIGMTIAILNVMTLLDPSKFLYQHLGPLLVRCWPFYVALACVLPLVIRDALKLTNRICGPIYRINREVSEWNAGKPFRPIQLRKDDFCVELVRTINQYAMQHQPSAPAEHESAHQQSAGEQATEAQSN